MAADYSAIFDIDVAINTKVIKKINRILCNMTLLYTTLWVSHALGTGNQQESGRVHVAAVQCPRQRAPATSCLESAHWTDSPRQNAPLS